MSADAILEIFRQSLIVVLKLCGPLLLASIVIGLVIAIFQAATQIHEQTLTFAPKLLVIGLILILGGSWMISVMIELFQLVFQSMIW